MKTTVIVVDKECYLQGDNTIKYETIPGNYDEEKHMVDELPLKQALELNGIEVDTKYLYLILNPVTIGVCLTNRKLKVINMDVSHTFLKELNLIKCGGEYGY